MHYHHKVLHATSIRLCRYPIRQGLDQHNAIYFSSLQFHLLLFYQSHQVFFIYLVWTVTTPGAVVFCCLFYSSLSGLLVSFQCPSSALFISSEHLPRRQVAGCRLQVAVEWMSPGSLTLSVASVLYWSLDTLNCWPSLYVLALTLPLAGCSVLPASAILLCLL